MTINYWPTVQILGMKMGHFVVAWVARIGRYLEIILGISSLSSPKFSKLDRLFFFYLSSLLYENRAF